MTIEVITSSDKRETKEALIKSNSPRSNNETHAAEFDTLRFNQCIPKAEFFMSVIFNCLFVLSLNFLLGINANAYILAAVCIAVSLCGLSGKTVLLSAAVSVAAGVIFHKSFSESLTGLVNCISESYGKSGGRIVDMLKNGGEPLLAACIGAAVIVFLSQLFRRSDSVFFTALQLIVFTILLFIFDMEYPWFAVLVYFCGFAFLNEKKLSAESPSVSAAQVIALLICAALGFTGIFSRLGGIFSREKFDIDAEYEVLMESPQPMYLIRNRYAVCEDGKWHGVSDSVKYDFSDSFYWLYKDGFYPLMQTAFLDKAIGTADESRITVRQLKGKEKVLYPYGTVSAEGAKLDEKEIDGGFYAQDSFYSFMYSESFLTKPEENHGLLIGGKGNDYISVEKGYRDYVYKTCTELSDEDREIIGNHFDLNISKTALKGRIKAFFSNAELDDNAESAGDNVLFRLLEKTCKGNEEDFASAAVKMLRAGNIPARFCEGYVITPDVTDGLTENSAVPVTDENRHCWAEYYKDGVGWIPFEVVPQYADMIKTDESYASSKPQTGVQDLSAEEQETPRQELYEKNSENENGRLSLKKMIVLSVCLLVLLLIILLVVTAFVKLYLRKRLMKKSPAERVCIVFRKSIKRLEDKSMKNPTPAQREESIKDKFGDELAESFEKSERVYEKAAFSRLEITESEEKCVLDFERQAKKAKRRKKA